MDFLVTVVVSYPPIPDSGVPSVQEVECEQISVSIDDEEGMTFQSRFLGEVKKVVSEMRDCVYNFYHGGSTCPVISSISITKL